MLKTLHQLAEDEATKEQAALETVQLMITSKSSSKAKAKAKTKAVDHRLKKLSGDASIRSSITAMRRYRLQHKLRGEAAKREIEKP